MLTTNDLKIKERDAGKLKKLISTNKTHPSGFKVKGKGAPPTDDVITTSNMEEYRRRYEKEMGKRKKK